MWDSLHTRVKILSPKSDWTVRTHMQAYPRCHAYSSLYRLQHHSHHCFILGAFSVSNLNNNLSGGNVPQPFWRRGRHADWNLNGDGFCWPLTNIPHVCARPEALAHQTVVYSSRSLRSAGTTIHTYLWDSSMPHYLNILRWGQKSYWWWKGRSQIWIS